MNNRTKQELWDAKSPLEFKKLEDRLRIKFRNRQDLLGKLDLITDHIYITKTLKYYVCGSQTEKESISRLRGVKASFDPLNPLREV